MLFGARAVEGIGYLLVVIAAPTAIAAIADDRNRAPTLALWSSFVPVGIAVGSAVTSVGVVTLGVQGIMVLWACLLAVTIIPILRLPLRADDSSRRRIVPPAPAAWGSSFAFGIYTLFLCALTMLLPTFLMAERAAALDEAGLVASIASLSALPASGLAILLIRRGRLSTERLLMIAVPSLVGTALLVPLALGRSNDLTTTSISSWGQSC
ncbi:MFS transporter [Sphingomonas sp.]|uniref:MFS transporter n=1 Tax=Sphingomonas sp. TaxID=28214 RepID=UPI0031D1B2D7